MNSGLTACLNHYSKLCCNDTIQPSPEDSAFPLSRNQSDEQLLVVARAVGLKQTKVQVSTSSIPVQGNKEAFFEDMETHLNAVLEGLLVQAVVGLLDVTQIDLGTSHDDPDEGAVVGAGASHGVVQALREVGGLVLDALG